MTCINLKTTFGKKYRITLEHDIDSKPLDANDPCTWQIPCQRGTIYPWGGDKLCVEVDYYPKRAAALAKMPGVECIQDGDQEKTFRFSVELFKAVAKIVRPHRLEKATTQGPKTRPRATACST
jgi:hypothetical protein